MLPATCGVCCSATSGSVPELSSGRRIRVDTLFRASPRLLTQQPVLDTCTNTPHKMENRFRRHPPSPSTLSGTRHSRYTPGKVARTDPCLVCAQSRGAAPRLRADVLLCAVAAPASAALVARGRRGCSVISQFRRQRQHGGKVETKRMVAAGRWMMDGLGMHGWGEQTPCFLSGGWGFIRGRCLQRTMRCRETQTGRLVVDLRDLIDASTMYSGRVAATEKR